MVQELTLNHLTLHEEATIVKIYGDDELKIRLNESGFVPGAHVTTICKTPFGGPTAYQLHGARIALRDHDTTHIIVSRPS